MPPRSDLSSSSTAEARPERFRLSGPSLVLDARVHAYRPDIADIALAGQLFAPHYARPLIRRAAESATALFALASRDAEQVAAFRPGDDFAVLDITGDWAWGYRRFDHCVGYVPEADLISADRG